MTHVPPSRSRLFGRGLLRRCARCGEGRLFRRWIAMIPTCPGCGHRFEREPGYWLGAIIVNTAVTFGLFIVIGVTIVAVTWPNVPWNVVLIVTLAFNGLFPVLFYPFSRTIWVALDLAFRPLEADEVRAAEQRLTEDRA